MIKYMTAIYLSISVFFVFPSNSQFEMNLGYGGYTVPGYWTPLFIKSNQNIKSGSIEIERINNSKNAPVEIFPITKNSMVECPVLINENFGGIIVRMYSGKEMLIERTIKANEKIFPGHIILTIDMNSRIQQALTHSLFPYEPVLTIPFNMEDLPSNGLSYDSISAVVMPDPGIRLTPSQTDALKYWIAGGGKLVLFGLNPGEESITNILSPGNLYKEKDGYIEIRQGYGKIYGFNKEAGMSEQALYGSEWKKILELEPYTHNLRFTSSKMFTANDNLQNRISDYSYIRTPIFIFIISWFLLFAILLLLPKKKYILLSALTLVCIISFVPAGLYLKKKWHGGTQYQNRVVVMPGVDLAAIDTRIWYPKFNGMWMKNNFSLWGIEADLGISEKAYFYPWFGKKSALVHRLSKCMTALSGGNTDTIEFSGYGSSNLFKSSIINGLVIKENNPFPDIHEMDFGNNANMVILKGNNHDPELLIWDKTLKQWKRSDSVPVWLVKDMDWADNLKRSTPKTSWLIGYDEIQGINLKLQKELCQTALWATPVVF